MSEFIPDSDCENETELENEFNSIIDPVDPEVENDENRNLVDLDASEMELYERDPCSVTTDYEENQEEMDEEMPTNCLEDVCMVEYANSDSVDDDREEEREEMFQGYTGVLQEYEEDEDVEDMFKSEGRIYLDIDCFDDFCKGVADQQQRLSKPIFVRGLPWRILAIPRDIQRNTSRLHRHLGFFLQCNGESESLAWNCVASANLTIRGQGTNPSDYTRKISHTFYPKENDWGFSQFINCDQLLNPSSGYIKDNTVRLLCHITADAPHGVQWDSKRHSGYVGLKNQGATCYMNSILQTFFFCSKFRKAVYEMPTTNDTDDNSVALALQRVFYDLQYSDRPVGTKKLTKSFGWDSLDSFLQHDAQELCRVLLDNLENKMKGTMVDDFIPRLFRGTMKSFIKCLDVDFMSVREEPFYDISLNVKGKMDIMESFREYVEIERLDGDNKYDAGPIYGHQPAEKGVLFLQLPPVLHLHLMRFQYDPHLDANVKINDRFEFFDRLDLNEFVEDRGKTIDNTYHLHAVLVHSGDFNGGHYVVFINTNLRPGDERARPKWCKFDDDVVSRASIRDAIMANFGGEDLEAPGRSFTSAYMLVYIRQDAIGDVLFSFTDDDIPQHIRLRFEHERAEENRRKKEKMEAHLYTEIIVLHKATLLRHHGFDLVDLRFIEEEMQREKVEKNMSVNQLYKFIAKKWAPQSHACGSMKIGEKVYDQMPFRLWKFDETTYKDELIPGGSLPRYRPSCVMHYGPEGEQRNLETALEGERNLLFIEGPDEFLPSYDENRDMLMFVKYYDGNLQEIITLGHLIMGYRRKLEDYMNHFRGMAKLPFTTPLRFYEEIAPDRVRQIDHHHLPLCNDNTLTEVNDGGIIIFESVETTSPTNNAKTFLEAIYNNIDVEICMNTENVLSGTQQLESSIFATIPMTWTCEEAAAYIGQLIGYAGDRIMLWKVSPFNERPQSFIIGENHKKYIIREILGLVGGQTHDPRRGKRYRLVYSKVRFNPSAMAGRRQMRIQVMDEKLNVEEITIFPDREGTVRDILDEVRHEFPFSKNGSGKLRLVFVGHSVHTLRVYQKFEDHTPTLEIIQKTVTPAIFAARVEEIPNEQIILRQNEYLLPVSHFDREPSRMFGVPFLLKVQNDEPLTAVRARLQIMLEVPDKEFEKYKFALISNGRIIRYLEMDQENKVNLAELGHTHMISSIAPFLGIDHINKNRQSRSQHNVEKAIVIHN